MEGEVRQNWEWKADLDARDKSKRGIAGIQEGKSL
jgi:hypothetical protein